MSVTTNAATVPNGLPHQTRDTRLLTRVRVAVWAAVCLDLAIVTAGLVADRQVLLGSWPYLLLWAVAAAAVGVAAIQTPSGQQLGLDMPILLAAGFVLGPIPAGLIAIAGYIDVREFRRSIAWERALFNRAQTSLSVMAASAVFHLTAGTISDLPRAFGGAILGVASDCFVNYAMVGGIMILSDQVSPRTSLARLRVGSVFDFAATYVCYGLLGFVLAHTYLAVGAWAIVLFTTPVVLARQALSFGQELEGAMTQLARRNRAITDIDSKMVAERRDERLAIASGLHDDVVPPLLRVHVLAQVLRQELATGRLLAMEDDLPELVSATQEANDVIRTLIQDLRSSSLGAGGLAETLRLLIRELEATSGISVVTQIADPRGAPVIELLTYQVAREALRNAVRHSAAKQIRVTLLRDEEVIRLQVEDNGRGFDSSAVDQGSHFGLALMKERVELAGGLLRIDSVPGTGTRVVARLPSAIPDASRLRA